MTRLKIVFLLIGLITITVYGQKPREIQLDDEPFDFTDPIKLIFVVIIPVTLLIIGAVIMKKRQGKK
jgi:hypothetical protein